jgi:hypothetical protein
MICRLSRGWTATANAAGYEPLVRSEVIPGIEARQLRGFRRIEVMRREVGDEVEFATLMWFDGLDAAGAFMGDDDELAHVPDRAREVLARFDERSAHFAVLDRRSQAEQGHR